MPQDAQLVRQMVEDKSYACRTKLSYHEVIYYQKIVKYLAKKFKLDMFL